MHLMDSLHYQWCKVVFLNRGSRTVSQGAFREWRGVLEPIFLKGGHWGVLMCLFLVPVYIWMLIFTILSLDIRVSLFFSQCCQVYFPPLYMSNYSQIYVFGSECFKNVGDLHSTLYLNASCVDTRGNYAESLLRFAVIYGHARFSVLSSTLFVGVCV